MNQSNKQTDKQPSTFDALVGYAPIATLSLTVAQQPDDG
jgi:hypothetical protein